MRKENIQFKNSAGENLAGVLDLPTAKPRAYALFAHCFTCSKNIRAATTISRALTEAGFAVLRFDFTGLGQSEGEFADSNFSSNVDDLVAAANYLQHEHEAPSVLIGHSLGGTAVLQAAQQIPSAVAVATIGSPANPAHVAHLFAGEREELEASGSAEVNLGGRPFQIKRQFLQDLESQAMPDSLASLRKAVLILHSPLDETVEIENASELFLAAKHPKSFVSLDNADHLLSREEDARYAGEVIQAWAARFLPEIEAQATVEEGVVLARTEAGGFFTSIQAGPHHLLADEPASVGGSNLGPTPYGLLSASLGACTTMTLQMYAARKKLDLKAVSVEVRHAKVHANDCVDCETRAAKVDEFQKVIHLEGSLSDEERQRLLEIADRCPVHRTLHSEVRVETQLASSSPG